jgi:serine/threonine-protein kinase RsbW
VEAAAGPPAPPCGPGGERISLDIPSRVSEIQGVVETVVARCVAREFPRRAVALNVPVALTEALANAIVKGNGEDAAKRVLVDACLDDRALVVEVHDEGEGFDLDAALRGPDADDFLTREDGRGLFLMRSLMDRVEQFAAARGNVVRLTLRRGA